VRTVARSRSTPSCAPRRHRRTTSPTGSPRCTRAPTTRRARSASTSATARR
jgi:hypothetical protein